MAWIIYFSHHLCIALHYEIVIFRMAKDTFSSVATGSVWTQWTVRLWFLSHPHFSWHPRDRVPHMASNGNIHGVCVSVLPWRRTTAEKPGLDLQWCRPLSATHHGHGKSSFATWDHSQKLWQVWNWVLVLQPCIWAPYKQKDLNDHFWIHAWVLRKH